jgi:hypothetical protein
LTRAAEGPWEQIRQLQAQVDEYLRRNRQDRHVLATAIRERAK